MTQRLNISEDWGTLNEVAEDLFRLRLFNPRGALLINTWIYRSALGLVVIDPGWPWTLAGLESALGVLGGTVETVHHWLYTHTHIDHMGLAVVVTHRKRRGLAWHHILRPGMPTKTPPTIGRPGAKWRLPSPPAR